LKKIKIITSGKQLDTIVYPHTIVKLDVISCGRHLENFNDGKIKVKEKSLNKMKINEKRLSRNKTKTQ